MKYILIATDEGNAVKTIRRCFDAGYTVETAASKTACIDLFSKHRFEFLFIDIELILEPEQGENFIKQLQPFWSVSPESEIIILTPPGTIRRAVSLVKAGASDYLTYPIDPTEVKYVTESIGRDQQLHSELKYLRNQFWRRESYTQLRTRSAAMKEVFDRVRAVAPTESTVLITGETGTGKGIIANLIHRHSRRSERQFIAVHCGAIPDTLLESELFGHERGAFTGADRRKLGKFEIAEGGTIFLDEIGTISPSMQIKLLQVLQDRTYQRVGGEVSNQADVRIIVATNADLKKMCDMGTFRSDLYYRLHVFPIIIPPLRERKEDIPLLVDTFIDRLNKFSLKKIVAINPEVISALEKYHWPGNIRELENVIERAYILETSIILEPHSFPHELFAQRTQLDAGVIDLTLPLGVVRERVVEDAERRYLHNLLAKYQGRINRSAEAAGVGVRQLHKLLSKYGLRKEDFKTSSAHKNRKN